MKDATDIIIGSNVISYDCNIINRFYDIHNNTHFRRKNLSETRGTSRCNIRSVLVSL